VLGLFGIFGGVFVSVTGLICPFLIKVRLVEKDGEKIIKKMKKIINVKRRCFFCVRYDKVNLQNTEAAIDMKGLEKELFKNSLSKGLYILILVYVIAVGLGSTYVSIFMSDI